MDADTQRKIHALEAKIALLKGETPEGSYKEDIKWYDQQFVKEFLGAVPRTFYCFLVGKQLKSLQDQATTYQIPVESGADIDLPEVLKWFHAFLTTWGPKIKKRQLVDEKSAERLEQKEQLELQQMAVRLKNLEADFERKSGNAMSSEEVEGLFNWYESELRRLGERLGKRFGNDAQNLFNTTLNRMSRTLPNEESSV